MPGPGGNVAPGLGGQRVPFKKPVERAASPLNQQRQALMQNNLTNGNADVRISTLSLLGAYAGGFAASKDPKVQKQAQQLADTISQLADDPDAPVSTWARLLQLTLEAPANRVDTLKQMMASDYWPQRLLAASGALASGEGGKETLQQLTNDAEPIVKKFAEAGLDDLAHPTTAPTTQSTTAPSMGAPATQFSPVTPTIPTSAPSIDLRL
jgi:hypothetical protein